jgi:thioredoxin 1
VSDTNPIDSFQNELGFIPHLPGLPEAINADSFDEDVLASPVPTLVEFWAARCGPCRRLAPELAAVATDVRNRARVFTLNVDEEIEAAERFGVRSIPAILLFVGGAEKARLVSDHITREHLVHLLRTYLTETEATADHAEDILERR